MSSKLDQPVVSKILFPGIEPDGNADSGDRRLVFNPDGTTTVVCRYFEAEPESPVILFFPSTTTALREQLAHAASFQKHGMSVIYVSYQVQGARAPFQTLSRSFELADHLVRTLSRQLHEQTGKKRLFVMGQSIATLLAIDSVLRNSDLVQGLILDSSICRTLPFLQNMGVDADGLGLKEEEGFMNLDKIGRIKLPTLIFHGAKDHLVSAAEAESLQACSGARSKQFFIIPGGGHGDLCVVGGETYFSTLKNFTYTTCGLNTWRQRRKKFKADHNENG
jgi:alpha-beta hydrolase superfamily lysophospholipase